MARATAVDPDAGRCKVYGCDELSRSAAGEGLDRRFCKAHADFYQRHGNPYRRSYSAGQLGPHRLAAIKWVKANADDIYVANAIQKVRGLYDSAGSLQEAYSLTGKDPAARANIAWARLRRASVSPQAVVAAWLAIELMCASDPQPVTGSEFKRVQAAKLVHRMASGTHKRWDRPDGILEMHVYPSSRGRVLRHIGAALEEAMGLIVEHRLICLLN